MMAKLQNESAPVNPIIYFWNKESEHFNQRKKDWKYNDFSSKY